MSNPVGKFPLTRSQWFILHDNAWGHPADWTWMCPVATVRLAEGLSVDDILHAIRSLAERHEALRSRIIVDSEGVHQVVDSEVNTEIAVDELPEGSAENLREQDIARERLASKKIDIERSQAMRAEVLTSCGRPVFLVIQVHHLFVDSNSLRLASREARKMLANLLEKKAATAGLPHAGRLRDRLINEQSERSSLMGDRALRHATGILNNFPNTSFPYHRAPEPWAFKNIAYVVSPKIQECATRIAARAGASTSSVFLTALNLVLGEYTGCSQFGWNSIISKPTLSPHPTVEPNIQSVYTNLEVSEGGQFDDSARRAFTKMLQAMRYSDYDHVSLIQDVARARMERGFQLCIDSNRLNWMIRNPLRRGEENDLVDLDSLSPAKVSLWKEPVGAGNGRLNLWVTASMHDDHNWGITFSAREELISREDLHTIIGSVENVLCRAAEESLGELTDGIFGTETASWPRQPDWFRLDELTWADLRRIREIILSYRGVCDVRLTPTVIENCGALSRPRLIAHVHTTDEELSVSRMREFISSHVNEPGVVAPDEFILSLERYSPEFSITDEIERQVTGAIVDLSKGYWACGGTAEAVPAIIGGLRDRGWHGIWWDDFLSGRPLYEAAARLRRIHPTSPLD
ncbi:condensation domain-containing protein [Streptomyces sp. NL15-2K]|uniref:condensation domain-containing protein n=1 Tax=Streptomyces sp. NL15-2K TaxID=376149 RepID=UPI000F57CFAB|nr:MULTISPECIES: condensation domain-containing protein [Actinomycetes]WKX11324.1 condensation domain-containing protein [Kutzneria buriramensis]GCB47270.1 polyketide synthase [Streptomyces sp. NL15-2K]